MGAAGLGWLRRQYSVTSSLSSAGMRPSMCSGTQSTPLRSPTWSPSIACGISLIAFAHQHKVFTKGYTVHDHHSEKKRLLIETR